MGVARAGAEGEEKVVVGAEATVGAKVEVGMEVVRVVVREAVTVVEVMAEVRVVEGRRRRWWWTWWRTRWRWRWWWNWWRTRWRWRWGVQEAGMVVVGSVVARVVA